MMRELVDLVQALNLSTHKSVIGSHFPEILALLSIVFGGAFLLFGWKHHAYFLGVTGFLTGGWAGLMLKSHLQPAGGGVTPMLYLATCSVAGAFVAICWRRFVGILLGGFTVAILGSVFFPKFFFVFNSSLIGAVFVTYGISTAIVGKLIGEVNAETQVLVHLCVFLPLLIFGVMYQLTTSQHEVIADDSAPRVVRT